MDTFASHLRTVITVRAAFPEELAAMKPGIKVYSDRNDFQYIIFTTLSSYTALKAHLLRSLLIFGYNVPHVKYAKSAAH